MIDTSYWLQLKERDRLIPKFTDGRNVPWANDVERDDRGHLFPMDSECSLDCIELDG